MEQENKNITEEKVTASGTPQEEKPVLAPGEKVFSVVLLILGLVAFGLALELWTRMSEPRIASAAALPLFATAVWVILALITMLQDFKLTSPLSAVSDRMEKIKQGLAYAFPVDVLVMLALVLVYCVLLFVGLSFYIATPLFLYAGMCYLMKKDYVKNILWTALVMVFIVLVFRMLFGVVFP
jgi:archaellum biogenesis protein FlaJ (TadC family)